MPDETADAIRAKLERLRIELVELAFRLECRGRLDAADVAVTTSLRVAELHDELSAAAHD